MGFEISIGGHTLVDTDPSKGWVGDFGNAIGQGVQGGLNDLGSFVSSGYQTLTGQKRANDIAQQNADNNRRAAEQAAAAALAQANAMALAGAQQVSVAQARDAAAANAAALQARPMEDTTVTAGNQPQGTAANIARRARFTRESVPSITI